MLLIPGRVVPSRGCVVLVERTAAVPTVDRRLLRTAGTGGGPIDVLELEADGRGRVAVDTTRLVAVVPALDGVPVRDGTVLDEPLPICFVGDLIGD